MKKFFMLSRGSVSRVQGSKSNMLHSTMATEFIGNNI